MCLLKPGVVSAFLLKKLRKKPTSLTSFLNRLGARVERPR